MMDFSIVVPFFNAESYIEQCARALLAQDYPADRYEILMADNNSTDRSAGIVKAFDRIKLLREPEQGSYAARNRCIGEAQGSIVAFTDPDCVPQPDWLRQIADAMQDPRVQLILGDRTFANDAGVLGMLAAYESELGAYILKSQRAECFYAYTNNMAVRSQVVRSLAGFQKLARGADTLFLQSVVEQYGVSAVKYVHGMQVRHLEIASVDDYLQKKVVYGQVQRNGQAAAPRPLPLLTRIRLALKARRRRESSLRDTFRFFTVLGQGAIRFHRKTR